MRITKRPWGEAQGREIWLFEIDNGVGMRACVSNYGGVLQSLFVRDRHGEALDVVLGYDSLEEYRASETFFGAMIGPIADRMAGGRCQLDGEEVRLCRNAGPDSMHSGAFGFHAQAWDWEILPDGLSFTRTFTCGDTGFPGKMEARLAYRVCGAQILRLEYAARCDRESAVSFTNHSYFNLDGGGNHCRDQHLTVRASRYAETAGETDPICTGRALSVEGTPLDLRSGCRLGDVLAHDEFPEICTGGGIDHFFLADGEGMREHARIESLRSGISLVCRSDAPGVLVYTANGLDGEPGKGGKKYEKNWAICLETERFPNAVNLAERRSGVILRPGECYQSATEFVFAADYN